MHPQTVQSVRWLLVAGALVVVGSCSDSSPAPTPIPTPNPVGSTAIVSLELTAPDSIPPGTTAQLTVRATRSNGTSEQLTSGVLWISTNPNILRIEGQGAAVAVAAGEARVTVRLGTRSASKSILVLPDGTYRLGGRIAEQDFPISGASVLVISGTGQGLSVLSDFSGAYAIYGVAGPIRLHIKKAGYENVIQDVEVGAHSAHNVSMAIEKPREPIGGQYRLTLTASGCSNIPSDLTRRTYDATVEQNGPQVTVRLSGANFVLISGKGNGFNGTYNADGRIAFTLGTPPAFYYYYEFQLTPDLAERLSDTSTLVINGSVTSMPDGRGVIAGTLSGTFNLSGRVSHPLYPYTATCTSSGHQFELRRR